jgi:HEAT repeat protein
MLRSRRSASAAAAAAVILLAAIARAQPEPALSTASQSSTMGALAFLRGAPEPEQRRKAIAALRQEPSRGPRTFKALAEAMLSDGNNDVRRDAAVALLDYEGHEPLQRLEAFFKGEMGEETRRSVCAALGAHPGRKDDAGTAAFLAGLLSDDESAAVRAAAVTGLMNRSDQFLLVELRRAAAKDPAVDVRKLAAAAVKSIVTAPKPSKIRPAPPQPARYDAVKGKDRCPPGNGWCECFRPPLKGRPRCITRSACEHTFFNSYQHQGFSCTFDGQLIE